MPKETPPIKRVNVLYKDCLLILEREVEHLKNFSIANKLSKDQGTHLINYIKLLAEMKKAQEAIVAEAKSKEAGKGKNLSEEQLQALISASPKPGA